MQIACHVAQSSPPGDKLRRLRLRDQLPRHLSGSRFCGIVVRFMPLAVILAGTGAKPQIQVIGTTGASSTTAGRSVSTLPRIWLLARVPKGRGTAPASSVTAVTRVPTILSAGG